MRTNFKHTSFSKSNKWSFSHLCSDFVMSKNKIS